MGAQGGDQLGQQDPWVLQEPKDGAEWRGRAVKAVQDTGILGTLWGQTAGWGCGVLGVMAMARQCPGGSTWAMGPLKQNYCSNKVGVGHESTVTPPKPIPSDPTWEPMSSPVHLPSWFVRIILFSHPTLSEKGTQNWFWRFPACYSF